jgi:hypothetical protein
MEKDRKVLGSVSWTFMSYFGGREGGRVMMKTMFIGAFDGRCRWCESARSRIIARGELLKSRVYR